MVSEHPTNNETERDTYRELFEQSADAILIIEGEDFVDANQAAIDMLGFSTREEVLRTHPSKVSPPTQPDGRDSFEKANEMIAKAFEQGSHRFEWDHRRADGTVFPVEVLLTAVRSRGKRTLHVVWRDITERKLLESQLRQSSKMEAIGRLAGGIAHDFNNLLVAILGHAELLALDLPPKSPLQEHIDELRSAGERAANLVQQLLAFSRKKDLTPRTVDLCRTVSGLRGLLQRLLGEDTAFNTVLAPEPVPVKMDPSQLEQIVLNLCTNARDAMVGGGTLLVEVRRIHVAEAWRCTSGPLPPGVYAQLAVTDEGAGMDAETLPRVFDPFFTTKEVGRGTGLGLATVYSITRQAGGQVDIHSTVGRGTVVKVSLPISLGAFFEVEPPQALPTTGGSETILVVEDEAAVASIAVQVLKQRGYHVLSASNGEEALACWEAHLRGRSEASIDLLLTDVIMPRMGGPQLVLELNARGHHPPVLFMSGYTNDALVILQEAQGEIDLLEKPFSTAELVGRTRLALDRSGGA